MSCHPYDDCNFLSSREIINQHEISLTVGVVARLKLEMSAILALLAIAIEDENLLVRDLQLAHDSRRIKFGVQDDYHAGFAVLLTSQLLTSELERGAPCVLAYLEIAVSLDGEFAGLVALLVVCAANKSQSYVKYSRLLFFHVLFTVPLRYFLKYFLNSFREIRVYG